MPESLEHLSTTLIGNWGDCPSRAWRSYVRRLEFGDDNEGTNPTRFGNVVHNTQEKIHQDIIAAQNGLRAMPELTDEYIMKYFDAEWVASGSYDFEIYVFGKDTIADFVRRGITKRIGRTIHAELLFVYEVETRRVWVLKEREEVQRIVKLVLMRGNTPVVSKIDRIDQVSPTKFEVYDYKTNILPFTRDYIENSLQLGVYDLVVRALYPEATEVECIFDMLRHGRFPVTFTDDQRDKTSQYLINLWQQIRATEEPEERLNKYCRWCEIRSDCKAYAGALKSNIPPVLTESIDTEAGITAAYAQFEEISDLVKLLEQRKTEIKDMITAKIVKDSLGEPLQVGNREYYLQQNPMYEYDKNKVIQILTEHKSLALLPTIIGGITKAGIDRGLKGRPELKEIIEPLQQKKFKSSSLKARRLDGGKSLNTEEPTENA